METVITVILAVLMLTVFVVVHEWGHYIVAKKCGICVLEFSIGFGPKIASFNSGETQVSIRAALFGGYVRFAGEEEEEANIKGSYLKAKLSHRALTVAAGPAMNILFAYLLAVVFFVRLRRFCAVYKGNPHRFRNLSGGSERRGLPYGI